jgi:hypothetical protein
LGVEEHDRAIEQVSGLRQSLGAGQLHLEPLLDPATHQPREGQVLSVGDRPESLRDGGLQSYGDLMS